MKIENIKVMRGEVLLDARHLSKVGKRLASETYMLHRFSNFNAVLKAGNAAVGSHGAGATSGVPAT